MARDAQGLESPTPLYWLLALMVVVLSIAAYTGYVVYPRFDLPAVTGLGLLVLAVGAGIASFFSPCAFPLLVTLLSREIGIEHLQHGNRPPGARALTYASALSLGASVFLLLTGAGLALGGGTLFARVTFTSTAGVVTRFVVGILLILLGLVQAGVFSNQAFRAVGGLAQPLARVHARLRREHPLLGFGVYGFGYLLAGFG